VQGNGRGPGGRRAVAPPGRTAGVCRPAGVPAGPQRPLGRPLPERQRHPRDRSGRAHAPCRPPATLLLPSISHARRHSAGRRVGASTRENAPGPGRGRIASPRCSRPSLACPLVEVWRQVAPQCGVGAFVAGPNLPGRCRSPRHSSSPRHSGAGRNPGTPHDRHAAPRRQRTEAPVAPRQTGDVLTAWALGKRVISAGFLPSQE